MTILNLMCIDSKIMLNILIKQNKNIKLAIIKLQVKKYAF